MQWSFPPGELYENFGKRSADSQFALVTEYDTYTYQQFRAD